MPIRCGCPVFGLRAVHMLAALIWCPTIASGMHRILSLRRRKDVIENAVKGAMAWDRLWHDVMCSFPMVELIV